MSVVDLLMDNPDPSDEQVRDGLEGNLCRCTGYHTIYPGIYKFDAYDFFCRGVFRTKTPTDSYRGADRPEATFAIERIMDELAAELGMDSLELRRRNWITSTEFPYRTIAGLTYDSGDYEAATARATELSGAACSCRTSSRFPHRCPSCGRHRSTCSG